MPDYRGEGKIIARLLRFHPSSAIFGVVVIAAAVIYKKMFYRLQKASPCISLCWLLSAGSIRQLFAHSPAIYQLASL